MNPLRIRTRWVPMLLNIIGLGIAFSVFLILMSQVWYDYRYDRFEGGKDVYAVEIPSFQEGLYSPQILRPLIQMVADSSPIIAETCDYFVMTRNDQVGFVQMKDGTGEDVTAYGISYAWTETSVLDVFSITLVEGRREDFAKEGDALISESAAKRFFPDRNPIGETFTVEFEHEGRITGIYKDRKENESMINGILVHEGERDMSLPNYNPHSCYVKLKPGADLEQVREAVGKVELAGIKDIRLTQIHDTWFEKDKERWSGEKGGNKLLCIILFTIALLFLGIAGFNYVNFSMASTPFRIREINTKKVFGASRSSLITRQLLRAIAIVGCSFLLGILTMKTLCGTQWASFLTGDMAPSSNVTVLCLGGAAALLLALLSGLIPALYSTSFQPALVLKGSFALSAKGGGLRTVTLILQYVLSFLFILCAMMLQRQTSYMVHNNELGFNYDRVLKMESHAFTRVKDVAEELRNIPGVIGVARGDTPIEGGMSSMSEMREGDDIIQYSFRNISPEYAEFFGLKLIDGRLPYPGESDVALVNESFHEALPSFGIGKSIPTMYGKNVTVIGILKDFHARTLEHDYSPLVLLVSDEWNYASFMIRVQPNADVPDILQKAKRIYSEMKRLDETEIDVGFLDKDIERLYEQEIRQTRLIRMSSFLSLIITLIGVLGLVWFDTRFMRKEIALRKVNGATRKEILFQLGRKYLLIVAVGFVVATPIAIAVCQRWLQHFAFRTNMPIWIFVLALAVVTLITIAVVITQGWLAASANPVDSLKNE